MDRQSDRLNLSRTQWLIATLLFAATLLNYLDRQILSFLVPQMRTSIGLTLQQYTTALNAFLLGYAFMYFGSGLVIDWVGSRNGLVIFVALWSVVSGLHGAIRGFWDLVVLRFLLGIFEPGAWTGGVKTVAENFAPAQRGIATGLFTSGSSVATVIAPPLVVFLGIHYGWRTAFFLPSTVGLLWVPLWMRVSRLSRKSPSLSEAQPKLQLKEIPGLLHDQRVLAYIAARFFGDSSGYFFLFWIPEYLVSTKHFSFAMLGALGWIPYLCNDVGPITGGYLSGLLIKRGAQPVYARKVIMSVGAGVVALGTLSQSSAAVWLILLSLSASMFGVGLWAGNLHTIPTDAFPRRIVGSIYGLAGSCGAVGGIMFNLLTGYLAARGNYSAVFFALALLEPLGAAALWLWLSDQ